MTIRRFMPDGSVRAIWSDDYDARTILDSVPARASKIEAIEAGKFVGYFHVDFTPLADCTGNDRYRVCLVAKFLKYEEARQAEVAWLTTNYVIG